MMNNIKEVKKTEASIIANCIEELKQLETDKDRVRALRCLAEFFEITIPKPAQWLKPGSGAIRYGAPFV